MLDTRKIYFFFKIRDVSQGLSEINLINCTETKSILLVFNDVQLNTYHGTHSLRCDMVFKIIYIWIVPLNSASKSFLLDESYESIVVALFYQHFM